MGGRGGVGGWVRGVAAMWTLQEQQSRHGHWVGVACCILV